MDYNHCLLFIFWLLFAFVHSFFANENVKAFCKISLRGAFRYYRLTYSIVAFASLVSLFVFQYSLESPYLFISSRLEYAVGLPLSVLGVLIMGACIYKYFRLISGVNVNNGGVSQLEIGGIHRYVRHPLYSGTLLFIWSVFLIVPLLSNGIVFLIISIYTVIGIKLEEKKLIHEFGRHYEDYIQTTPGLVPRFPPVTRMRKPAAGAKSN